MLRLNLGEVKTVLCLGAHADDIEIGCGGTILKLARDHPRLHIFWIVFSAEGVRSREARRSASAFLRGVARKRIIIKQFRNGFFPFEGARIKDYFERLKTLCEPDIVFSHYRDDRHQDHRVLSDLTWNTFRDHLILEYEIPKYDGDLGGPNLFFPLDETTCKTKVALLKRHFRTQADKHWFTDDVFLSLLRLRGVECASAARYAEAYYCRKLALR
jgi:LmbE family N-acetylglucosaminyl deacetylase